MRINILLSILLITTFAIPSVASDITNFRGDKSNPYSSIGISTQYTEFVDTFKIFPNPASAGYINIISVSRNTKEIAIYDVLGEQVLRTTISGDRLNISSLKSGIYILRITQDSNTATKKLIVN